MCPWQGWQTGPTGSPLGAVTMKAGGSNLLPIPKYKCPKGSSKEPGPERVAKLWKVGSKNFKNLKKKSFLRQMLLPKPN